MEITTELIKALRDETGVSVMQCKKALQEADGDKEKAKIILRKQSSSIASKKSDRALGAGIASAYTHAGGSVVGAVVLACETDFVAKNEEFAKLAYGIAMHIAAMNPLYLDEAAVPQEVIDKEREIYKAEMAGSNKPEEIMGKIIEGKVAKFYTDVCLLKQQFIKDESMTIEEVIKHGIAKMGENIQLKRFVRFHLGQD